MVTLKVSGLLGLIFLYFGLLVFGPWYGHFPLQLGLGAVLIACSLWRHGFRTTVQSLWMILPFVLTLILFGAVFQWLELMGRTDWLHDSLLKGVVFPNSFLVVKLCLESVSFRDLTRLPIGPGTRRPVIILKAVMEKCTPLLHRYRFFMELTPHFEGRRWKRFARLCAVVIALYISLYQQTEKTRDLYDHRLRHIRGEK